MFVRGERKVLLESSEYWPRNAAPYPTRHRRLPQQRMIWPQISVVPRLRILSLKGLKGKKATIRETI